MFGLGYQELIFLVGGLVAVVLIVKALKRLKRL